ncbi:cytochrome p450 monooxygenase [Neofusicoccum parvum]|uniref:Cytochrome p450 monooxygenase n=1 Tax=Neofusicoccum parvum TaxID=310453 RepID=A0ACB5SD73_9PEZI|nr:cytochrome p450 monooxygenase [Neofusicoccum parvum]
MTGARAMVREGYKKFKSSMFKVRRNDKDILVISNKYIDELRNLPDSKLSAIGAQVRNLLGRYSTTPILLESDLHTRVLQTKLTPNLPSLIPILKDELDHALPKEIPECKDEWVEVQIYEILCQIVARLTARVFLGEKGCESEEWLAKSIEYTENIFKTVMVLRVFPTYIRPFIAPFLPPYWKMQSDLVTAKKIISPMVRERRQQEALLGAEYAKPHDLLQWMMDASDDDDGQPDKLAHRQLLLSLASIHTTTMSAAHALYDLCAYPECFEPLRDEAIRVLSEDEGWKKTTLTKMRNLDSFLKESQRINPPIFMTFNRVVRSPITLSDGTQLPVGAHLTVASDATSHDPDIIPSPDRFDPFRWARLRQSDPSSAHKHQFATTDVNSLHFGHGRHACPGRFFAAAEIKMLLAQLLLDYDFKYPQGQGRPINLSADDWLFPDPNARLLIRRRSGEGQQGAV